MSRPPINRRQALSLIGGASLGAVALGACSSDDDPAAVSTFSTAPPSTSASAQTSQTAAATAASGDVTVAMFGTAATCTLTPEQTEGPYYIDVDKIRADIREDREGTPLRVAVRVVDKDGCTPIKDAIFEIWHCDAGGLYSGFEAASQGGGGGARDDKRYLRGAQTTNADGLAVITTIYPGWYGGRTVHIHAKVSLSNTEALTSQLYFDEELTDKVFAAAPYSAHPDRDTRNDNDGIYRKEVALTVNPDGDGYLGLITIGVAG